MRTTLGNMYSCIYCNKLFRSYNSALEHEKRCNKYDIPERITKNQCRYCQSYFKRQSALDKHEKLCSYNPERLDCNTCANKNINTKPNCKLRNIENDIRGPYCIE